MSGEPIIRVRGLKNSFGEQIVHEGLDLDVPRGEILGVVGGSGTGKSVLMRSIIGLQTPDEGSVEVFGEPMLDRDDDDTVEVRKRWGVLFQGGALFSTLTVAENVQVPLKEFYPDLSHELLNEIAAYKVVMTGLPAEAGPKYPAELSGGMRKRAGLARALALDPELLFLDEPTTGFDPSARRQAWETLRGLTRLGKTILLTTHFMDEAQALADRVAVMTGGLIVATGTVDELIASARPLSRIRFRLPESVAPPEALGARRDGSVWRLETATPTQTLRDLTEWAVGADVELADLEVARRSLEDTYLTLTGAEPETAEEVA
jgi:phospholipid/cholesterol/gamma-HCH transport system ATP-binding protein